MRREESRLRLGPGMGSEGALFIRGGALDGEVGRRSCGCAQGVVGSRISAISADAGAGIEVDGGFGFVPARSERASVGIVSVMRSGPGRLHYHY